MKKTAIGWLATCLVLSLFVGCGKRENPLRPAYPFHEAWQSSWRANSLENNLIGDSPQKSVFVYLPPQYDPTKQFAGGLTGFPVLYLLHDFGGDDETFVSVYKVAEVADQLIADLQIDPLIIVMPDVSSIALASDQLKTKKAGTFYTNSALLGRYEDYIAHDVMDSIELWYPTVGKTVDGVWIPDRNYHAISGQGMGGYGALKIAMDYDTLFASVSALSPFTSFESFLTRQMIDSVYKENGIGPSDFSPSSYRNLNPWEDSTHPDKTYSQLIFAMAAAFSPHDLGDPDTSQFFALKTVSGIRYGADIPFDSTRTISPGSPVWYKWLLNDLTFRLDNDPTAFGDLSIYIDCGDQDQLGLLDGTRTFDQRLSLYGKSHTYQEYSGYAGAAADHDRFIHDRLPEILKFHSKHFGPPKWEAQ
ncbi:MAG: alpha/beta hydrolase-fold protein [Candidatus Zixiibacteriota bacterium]